MAIRIFGTGGSGAYKLTATCSSEYIGATITATLGTKTVTAVVGSDGIASLSLATEGTWTISNSINSFTQSVVVVLKAMGNTAINYATINVTSNTNCNGTVLTFTNGTHAATATIASGSASVNVAYSGTWTVSAPDTTATATVSVTNMDSYGVTYIPYKVYTIKITAAESAPYTRVVYQDDAVGMTPVTVNQSSGAVSLGSWSDAFFMQQCYPCMLKYDGTEAYKLNPNNYALKADGTSSDVANASFSGNAMAFIPKFYSYARTDSSGNEYYSICSHKINSNYESVGFKRSDGSEMDGFYWGMFFGSWDSSNRLRSISGTSGHFSTTMQQESDAAALNGSNWDVHAHAQRYALEILWLLCFKTDDSQTAHGAGCSHTTTSGQCNTTGPIGKNTSTNAVKFMHIEDLCGGKGDRIKGFVGIGNGSTESVYVKMAKPYNLTGYGYTQVTGLAYTTSAYISKSTCLNSLGRIPVVLSGSSTTYQCDYIYYNNGNGTVYPCICGWSTSTFGGLWSRYLDVTASSTDAVGSLGAALSFEPPAA